MESQVIARAEEPTKVLRFAPDGALLAGGRGDGVVALWLLTPSVKALSPVRAPTELLCDIAIHPNGKMLATSGDLSLALWSLPDGHPVRELPVGREECMHAVAFDPSGARLLAASGHEVIRVIPLPDGPPEAELPAGERTSSIVFHPGGKTFAATCAWQGGSEVRFWRIGPKSEFIQEMALDCYYDVLSPAAFSPDGGLLAFADQDVNLIEFPSGNFRFALSAAKPTARAEGGVLDEFWSECVFTPDGRRLACGSPKGEVVFWDTKTGAITDTIRAHEGAVMSIALRGDGSLLATSGADGTVKLWHL